MKTQIGVRQQPYFKVGEFAHWVNFCVVKILAAHGPVGSGPGDKYNYTVEAFPALGDSPVNIQEGFRCTVASAALAKIAPKMQDAMHTLGKPKTSTAPATERTPAEQHGPTLQNLPEYSAIDKAHTTVALKDLDTYADSLREQFKNDRDVTAIFLIHARLKAWIERAMGALIQDLQDRR